MNKPIRRGAPLVAVFLACHVYAETNAGRIVAIADGDTLTLLDTANRRHKIRLAGIDAPEKRQGFGERAKANLSALAFNQEAIADCPKRDRYRREICVVMIAGRDIGLEQISVGMAWWYRQYAREQTAPQRADYEAAEFMAKAGRLGLWADENPTPPWEWRRAMQKD